MPGANRRFAALSAFTLFYWLQWMLRGWRVWSNFIR